MKGGTSLRTLFAVLPDHGVSRLNGYGRLISFEVAVEQSAKFFGGSNPVVTSKWQFK